MSLELVRRALEYTNGLDDEASDEELAEVFALDIVLDMSTRVFNPKVYEGYDGLREFRADALEVWESLTFRPTEIVEEGDCVLVRTRVTALGRGSGVPMESDGAGIWRIAGGRLAHFTLMDHADREDALAALRAQAAGSLGLCRSG